MRRRSAIAAGATGIAALVAVVSPVTSAGPEPLALGATIRVTTPGTSACPAEGEPEITVTRAGTWVAYNDDHECFLVPGSSRGLELQLLPPQGAARFVPLPTPGGNIIQSDPDLSPAPDGGVFLSALWDEPSGDLGVGVLHVSPSLRITALPMPAAGPSDDKPFAAVDTSRTSRYRGRLYVAWDDFTNFTTQLSSWDGRHWTKPTTVQPDGTGSADIAVGRDGTVAVVTEQGAGHGAQLRFSHNGGTSFGPAITVFDGEEPGVLDPSCPLDSTVGVRQRALMSPRVAYDAAGDLHVVAAIGHRLQGSTNVTDLPGLSDGAGAIEHAIIHRGRVVRRDMVTSPTSDQQWAPALSALPGGGVAVAWLQTTGAARSSYDAWIAASNRAHGFAAPQRLSTDSSTFPPGMEAVGNSFCYGIGDYIGMAPAARGVVTAWPTTAGTTPGVDSDVLVRPATTRHR